MTDQTQDNGNKATGKLPSTARVVVIGGGSVGTSVLYHLAKMGWTDCVLLEKNELTSGSTWHAAGNCPNYAANWTIMQMQSYSNRLYRSLGEEVDYPMNYHVTGAIRLAHSKERMEEFRHVEAMGRQMGIEFQEMSNAEMQEVYPFLETHDLYGGQWDPLDGDIDPAQLSQAFAKGARDMGAQVIRFCPVTGVERVNDEWLIKTENGDIRCEYVVNAAGYRADEIGKMFGRDVPCVSMAHQYLITESIDELTERKEKLPLLRDPDSSYYLRQEKDGLLLGPYEYNCKAHWVTEDDPRPADFSFQLWNDDLDRIEWYIEDAIARVPILGSGGITRVVNGPIPYAPDGLPLIGPMPGVPNAFEACVFTFGIVQAGGAGKLVAEMITEGETESDSWSVDPRRFTDHVDRDYSIAKAIETYSHEYAMHFPHIQWPAGRGAKTSPIYDTLKAKGASFGSYGGWERAEYFLTDGMEEKMVDSYNHQSNFDAVGAECRHVAEHAGLLDLTGFSRYEIKGEGARAWLDTMVTGRLPKEGRIGLVYFASEKGKTLTEMTATCFGENHFWLITGAGALWHDRDWLVQHMPQDGSVEFTDITRKMGSLLVTGPKSPAIFEKVTGAAADQASFPWLTHQPVTAGGVEAVAIRVSFAGEAGWELHADMDKLLDVWTAITEAGEEHNLGLFGMLALDSMRLEKGYRCWKSDLTSDYTMLESGLGRWVNFNKDEFVGKAALQAEMQRGASKRFVTMTVEDPADGEPFGDAVYLSPIQSGGKDIGLVVSAGYGHRVGKSIAYGVIEESAISSGLTDLSISVLGRDRAATIVEGDAVYDQAHEKVRA
ncbi:MAG: FAD-dependent oxidoreductase [Alphaproteobacteria bacterium]|nr:FAD-dependent oxidoreductase [Alphaproteobacteria bacterium]